MGTVKFEEYVAPAEECPGREELGQGSRSLRDPEEGNARGEDSGVAWRPGPQSQGQNFQKESLDMGRGQVGHGKMMFGGVVMEEVAFKPGHKWVCVQAWARGQTGMEETQAFAFQDCSEMDPSPVSLTGTSLACTLVPSSVIWIIGKRTAILSSTYYVPSQGLFLHCLI